jgi:hypothetical protein
MAAGVALTIGAPAVIGAGLGYAVYRLVKGSRSPESQP